MRSDSSSFPSPITTLVAGAVFLLGFFPLLSAQLELGRMAFGAGEWWQVWTGQLVHWSWEHLAWDAIVFLSLGAWVESRTGRWFAPFLLAASAACGLAFLVLRPELGAYRGLSGVDSALFGFVCMSFMRRGWGTLEMRPLLVGLACLGLFGAKLLFELSTGGAVFVGDGSTFVGVPEAHAAGFAVGLLGAMLPAPASAPPEEEPAGFGPGLCRCYAERFAEDA